MAELNLALKKDIFEALQNKTSNEIPIKKNDWWKKRLIDPDTGRFKWFDVVVASCGSSDKCRYEIDHIESRDDEFVIIVVLDNPVNNEIPEDDQVDLDEIDGKENVETKGDIVEPESIEPEIVTPEKIQPVILNNFDFKRIEITQTIDMSDEEYLYEIVNYLEELLKNSYVFVNKKYSGFATSDFGELIFKLAVVSKKKYLFIRK